MDNILGHLLNSIHFTYAQQNQNATCSTTPTNVAK